jgi:hypothetical protein
MSNMTPQSHIDLMQRISCIVVIDTKVPLPKPCYFAGPYSISMHKSEQQRYYRILNGWCRFRNCVVLACWANWKIEVLSWPLCNSGLCIGVKHDPVKIISSFDAENMLLQTRSFLYQNIVILRDHIHHLCTRRRSKDVEILFDQNLLTETIS